jgi:glycosyltransferase involved in cell wall biosynthesis
VTQHVFENYAIQRNFALGLAKGTWILFLDADERLRALKTEIIQTVKIKRYTAYYFNRTFMFCDKRLHYSWQTDKIVRLFRKKSQPTLYKKTVHEKLHTNGETGKLKNKLIHYSYTTYFTYKEK